MLCDDHDKVLIEPIGAKKDRLKKLYDFDLMEDGGHITGWLVEGKDAEAFNDALDAVFCDGRRKVYRPEGDADGLRRRRRQPFPRHGQELL